MNPALKQIWRTSCLWTFLLSVLVGGAGCFLWPDQWISIGAGAAAGALIGLAGLRMIFYMTMSLTSDPKAEKRRGFLGYTSRYLFYAVSLFFLTWCGLNPLAMLAGILCSKASLVIYALQHRKDNE